MGYKEEMFSHAAIAALFYHSSKIKPQNMYGLGRKLVELKNNGVNHGIITTMTALGPYSENVEQHYGSFDIAGDAISRNPVKLNEDGLELCREVIRNAHKENPEETKKMLKLLGLEKEQICF